MKYFLFMFVFSGVVLAQDVSNKETAHLIHGKGPEIVRLDELIKINRICIGLIHSFKNQSYKGISYSANAMHEHNKISCVFQKKNGKYSYVTMELP